MNFAVKYVYPVLHFLLWVFMRFYHWPTFRGRENLPEGPCVICCNHSGFADPLWVFMAMGTKYPPYTMAQKSVMDKPFGGWFLSKFRVFPVDRDNADLNAIKKSLKILKSGEKLLIFPEGTRVKHGKQVRAKAGAVMLAQRTGVPIVPVYLTHDRKPFQPIRCIIGPAYQPAYSAKKISTEEMQRHTDELMARIYQMGAEA